MADDRLPPVTDRRSQAVLQAAAKQLCRVLYIRRRTSSKASKQEVLFLLGPVGHVQGACGCISSMLHLNTCVFMPLARPMAGIGMVLPTWLLLILHSGMLCLIQSVGMLPQ